MNFIPARQDFTKMFLPVCFYVEKKSGLLEIAGKEIFDIQNRFNEINPVILKNKKVFVGPSGCYSESIPYNKIIGIDNIDLYLEMDDGTTDFKFGVSENGFFKSGAYLGEVNNYESDDSKFKKIEVSPGMNAIETDFVFEVGNFLSNKYDIRKGSTINFHCFETDKNKSACLFFIPKKRDQDSILIDFVSVNKDEDLNIEIASSMIENNPKKDKYKEIVVSKFEFDKDVNLCVGFFEISTHINIFDFDAVTRLHGISFND